MGDKPYRDLFIISTLIFQWLRMSHNIAYIHIVNYSGSDMNIGVSNRLKSSTLIIQQFVHANNKKQYKLDFAQKISHDTWDSFTKSP